MSDSDCRLWPAAAEPHPALAIVVVVPVRDEAAGLTATLASLVSQRGQDDAPFDRTCYEVLLLANNCSDDSANLARAFGAAHPGFALHVEEVQLPAADAHIGHVRRVLMDAACRRLERVGAAEGIVASTDGDTVVDPRWLAATLLEFQAGVDAVGGRIELDPQARIDPGVLRRQRCDAAHRLAQAHLEDLLDPDLADPWPRHHQHFCASLAVSRAAYRQVGGLPAVRYLEDEALVAALRLADLRLRHSPQVRVRTSPRRDGRVEVGLSWQLRQWGDRAAGAPAMMVEDADAFAARLQQRRQLREAWRAGLAAAPAHGPNTFGALWAERQPAAPMPQDLVPVRQAIDRLKFLIGVHAAAASPGRSNRSSR